MQKVTKKSRLHKKVYKFECLSKRKLVTTSVHGQAFVRLTGKQHIQAFVTSISFLNANHSNFLNAFFMRPVLKMWTLNFVIRDSPKKSKAFMIPKMKLNKRNVRAGKAKRPEGSGLPWIFFGYFSFFQEKEK